MSEPTPRLIDVGATLGPFRLVRLLGEGGTGCVFLAERTDFAQRVAIKVFHPEFARAATVAPDFEEQLLSALDHPHIVRLLDRAVAPTGERYLVMEYVDGEPIDAFCDARRLTVRQRLELLLPALQAVAHAHQRLVLHLDLKPANVLAADEGGVKLVDFGAGVRATDGTTAIENDRAMTPDFASPEQRIGEPVGVATDVFGLGLLLRLVLAGIAPGADRARPPSALVGETAGATGAGGRPHLQAFSAMAEVRGCSTDGLRRQLRGDLDVILQKALAERPTDRYATAQALHDDLVRHLAGLPVAARRTGAVEVAWKWVARHRTAAAMAAVLLLTIAISGVGVVWSATAATRERRLAELRLHELVRLTGTLDSELYDSVRALPNAASSSDAAEAQALLTHASATALDGLLPSVGRDAALRSELAGQYEQLARLELSQTGDAAARLAARTLAAEHLGRALALMTDRDPRRAELERLRRVAMSPAAR